MSIEIVSGGARMPEAEFVSLNKLLRLYGGSWQGQPQFLLSWAGDDNQGLRKKHTCGRTDPWDWECSCKPDLAAVPLCFASQTQCYHLLSFHPQPMSLGEEPKAIYDCVIHFADAWKQPVRPTATIIERVIPVLQHAAKAMWAARYGVQSVLTQERREKKAAFTASEERKSRAWRDKAMSVLDAVIPDSRPRVGYGTVQPRFSNITESDLRKKHVVLTDL